MSTAEERMQNEIDELEQENRLLRARNDRLEAEANAAQPAPVQQSRSDVEPVAWMYWQSCLNDDGTQSAPWVQRYSKFKPPESVINKEITPLYTTPPNVATPLASQRSVPEERKSVRSTWAGLTDEEIRQDASWFFPSEWWAVCKDFARTIENELKEKNS